MLVISERPVPIKAYKGQSNRFPRFLSFRILIYQFYCLTLTKWTIGHIYSIQIFPDQIIVTVNQRNMEVNKFISDRFY